MSNDDKDKAQRANPPEPATKRPYEPPAVISEEVFETLALACNPKFTKS